MQRKFIFVVFLVAVLSVNAQYKNDNVLFKTVDWRNLCTALQNNKGYLLLDVRSAGEYNDTSAFTQLNLGHLKGAVNINVRELGTRLPEIDAWKNKTVFVYCSHSQRSRRASKMLADSGFTNVININAGITDVYYGNEKNNECLRSLLETKNQYNVISSADLCKELNEIRDSVFVLDVRSDSAFKHISTDAQINAYGIIRQSVNIPLTDLENNLLAVPRNKKIVITDLSGSDASKAAFLLKQKGFENVSMLIEGIDRWLTEENQDVTCMDQWYESPVSYHLINAATFAKLISRNKDKLILDVRTTNEFANRHKDSYRNIGHVKNAVNISTKELNARAVEIGRYKNKPVLVYDFSGDKEAYEAANTLVRNGFLNVNVLVSGLFNIRWTAANLGQGFLKDLVIDIPADNL